MTIRGKTVLRAAVVCLGLCSCWGKTPPALSPEQQAWVGSAKRADRAGWIYLHVEGEPRPRGFQHGYLLAHEIAEGVRVTRVGWEHQSGMSWSWLVERAASMFVPKIDAQNLAELGDINTHEIARLELGLKYVAYEKKREGYFIGSNIAENLKILRLETDRNDTDIRLSSVARRVRWKQLMKQHSGRIDLALAKRFEADHLDTYRGRAFAGGRTLCGHFELDPDGVGHGVPFSCSGTVDAKVVDAASARKLAFDARWGSACGMAFSAGRFLSAHPQFEWMTDVLADRKKQPWVTFQAGE